MSRGGGGEESVLNWYGKPQTRQYWTFGTPKFSNFNLLYVLHKNVKLKECKMGRTLRSPMKTKVSRMFAISWFDATDLVMP